MALVPGLQLIETPYVPACLNFGAAAIRSSQVSIDSGSTLALAIRSGL